MFILIKDNYMTRNFTVSYIYSHRKNGHIMGVFWRIVVAFFKIIGFIIFKKWCTHIVLFWWFYVHCSKKFWFMQMYICISQRNKWVCPKSDFLKNCDFGWFFLHHKIAAEVRSYLIQYVYCVPVHNYSIFNLNLWRTSIPPQYYSSQSVNLAELG